MIDVQINDWVAATYENTWLLLVKTTGFQALFSITVQQFLLLHTLN